MVVSLVYSNVLATVGVLSLPLIGGSWVAPKLSLPVRRQLFVSFIWGIPFLLGQYSQADEWGPVWMQYHLGDLAYVPWGTALAICLLSLGARLLGNEVAEETLVAVSFAAILLVGYASEIWDTCWAWGDAGTLMSAIDVGDYVTFTAGMVITVVPYILRRAATRSEVS